MPFTFCHPALVLPLHRVRFFSMTGLVAGSMAPDFEYFIRMADKRVYTHTWQGMLWYDLPLAVVLAFLFHLVVRNALIRNLPAPFQKRLLPFCGVQWTQIFKKRTLAVLFSIVVGVASHLLWDAFTHENSAFGQSLPLLTRTFDWGGTAVEGHLLLQVGCSLLGALAIFMAIWQLPPQQQYRRPRMGFWIKTLLAAAFIFYLRMFVTVSAENEKREWEDWLIPLTAAALYALLFTSLLELFLQHKLEKVRTFKKFQS